MAATKLVLLGMFLIVVGLAVESLAKWFVSTGGMELGAAEGLVYVAIGLFVIGFIAGVTGFIVGSVRK